MTVDALLTIFLAVLIPAVMAAMGGILAAKVLPSDPSGKNIEKWWWIVGFVALTIAAIVLAFVQQVRATTRDIAEQNARHQQELVLNGEVKRLQGQQDTTNTLLGKLISSNSVPQSTADILKGLIRQQQSSPYLTGDQKRYPHYLTNAQLQRDAETAVSNINELVNRTKEEERQAEDTYRQPGSAAGALVSALITSLDKAVDEYNAKYRSEAQLLRDEILARLPRDTRHSSEDKEMAIEHTYQMPTNPIGLSDVAADLDKLAKSLPRK